MRIGIVGAGIFGLSAALELVRRKHAVTVFDQGEPPFERAASCDYSKVLRFEYGPVCPLYVPLVEESRTRYRALEARAGKPLYVETGVLALARAFDPSRHEWLSHNYLVEHDYPVEVWTPAEARRRYPQFSYAGIEAVTWNAAGGYVRASDAVRATAASAREAGATLVVGARVLGVQEEAGAALVSFAAAAGGGAGAPANRLVGSAGDALRFDAVLMAAGAWFGRLVPTLAQHVAPACQFVTYYRPRDRAAFAPPAFPVWMHDLVDSGWYGVPAGEEGLVKVARHQPAEPADPDAPRVVLEEDRAASRAFVAEHLPALGADTYAEDRGCLYAMTGDGHFLIDRLPGCARLYVAGGGSGHGFKLGPAVGRLAADLVERGERVHAFTFDAERSGSVT